MHVTARAILARAAEESGCEIVLPVDAVTATEFKAGAGDRNRATSADVPDGSMILDVGPGKHRRPEAAPARLAHAGVERPARRVRDAALRQPARWRLAHAVADATAAGTLRSVAGGGDTVSALRHAGVMERLTYVSSAGGAFLEWLEGKTLPGVAVLMAAD